MEYEERLLPLEMAEVIPGEPDDEDDLPAPSTYPEPREAMGHEMPSGKRSSISFADDCKTCDGQPKKTVSVRRIHAPDGSTEGLSYAITEEMGDGVTRRKSMKVLDGFSASVLAKVLGTSLEAISCLPEGDLESANDEACFEIPENIDVVFEVAAKLGVAEVRVAETTTRSCGRMQRFSMFQKSAPEDGSSVLALGDQGLVTVGSDEKARSVETGFASTNIFAEGGEETMHREERLVRDVQDSQGLIKQTQGDRDILVRRGEDGVLVRDEVATLSTAHQSGVTEVTQQTVYEKADELGVIEREADQSHVQTDTLTGKQVVHTSYERELDGQLCIEQRTDAYDKDGNVRTNAQYELTDVVLGMSETIKEATYDVMGKDGEIVQGRMEQREVTDHLTGVTTVETDEVYLQDGEVEERVTLEETGPDLLPDGSLVTYSTKETEYVVHDSLGVKDAGATACRALTDEEGYTVGTATIQDTNQTQTIDYSVDQGKVEYSYRPQALADEPMQGAPAYAMRQSSPPGAAPEYTPGPAASPPGRSAADSYSTAPTTPPRKPQAGSRPGYTRPADKPRVPGSKFSSSPEVELVGDLGPLAGRYMRCGVVNGCTAWVQHEDPEVHLFWEAGPLGPGWTVGTGPHVSQTFRRLILPSSPRSSPPPERRWIRIGEEVSVSVRRPPATNSW